MPFHRSKRPTTWSLILLVSASLLVHSFVNPVAVMAVERIAEPAASTDANKAKEYSVKAAFLYNFLNYTTWPEEAFTSKDAPVVIGIFGEDPFDSIIDKLLAKKKKGDRSIVIRRFKRIEDVQNVHVVFLGEMKSKLRTQLYAHLADQPVLAVGDARDMAGKDNCLFSFYVSSGKVRFEASLDAIKRANLVVSSQLLKLADIVEKRR